MDHATNSSTSSTSTMMMTPYLHFTGGDYLFFKSLTPSSKGALAGAAFFLFFLAVFERYIVAMRSLMELRWRQRAQARLEKSQVLLGDDLHDPKASQRSLSSLTRARVIPPFILSHDIGRGVMHALQSFLHFALMLAVMTFHVAYIIAIIAGLGVGEGAFGRLSFSGQNAHSH